MVEVNDSENYLESGLLLLKYLKYGHMYCIFLVALIFALMPLIVFIVLWIMPKNPIFMDVILGPFHHFLKLIIS